MTMRRSGFTDEDDRLAKVLMAEFERVEHRPITASWVATFADLARAVRLDREQPPAVPDPTVALAMALSEAMHKRLADWQASTSEAYFPIGSQHGPTVLVDYLLFGPGSITEVLAARAAAPVALRVRVEALAAEWEARGRDQDSFYRRRAADLRALLEETQ